MKKSLIEIYMFFSFNFVTLTIVTLYVSYGLINIYFTLIFDYKVILTIRNII